MAQGLILAMALSEGLGARLPTPDSKHAYGIFVLSGMAARQKTSRQENGYTRREAGCSRSCPWLLRAA